MSTSSKHFWHYEVMDPKSRWFFINPSEFAESLGLYVIELGHFSRMAIAIPTGLQKTVSPLISPPHLPHRAHILYTYLSGQNLPANI